LSEIVKLIYPTFYKNHLNIEMKLSSTLILLLTTSSCIKINPSSLAPTKEVKDKEASSPVGTSNTTLNTQEAWVESHQRKKEEMDKYLEQREEAQRNKTEADNKYWSDKYNDMRAKFDKDIATDNSTVIYPDIPQGGYGGTKDNYFKTNYTYYEFNMTKEAEVANTMARINSQDSAPDSLSGASNSEAKESSKGVPAEL
jgi:hypothetical protein